MNKKITLAVNNAFAVKKWIEPEEWVKVIVEEIGVNEIQLSFDLFYMDLKESDSTIICDDIASAPGTCLRFCSTSTTTGMSFCRAILAASIPAFAEM